MSDSDGDFDRSAKHDSLAGLQYAAVGDDLDIASTIPKSQRLNVGVLVKTERPNTEK